MSERATGSPWFTNARNVVFESCETVAVSVGGEKVTVVANGLGDIISIKIAKEVVDPEDTEMLEDLILSGVKQAIEKGKSLAQSEVGRLTSGLGLPPGMI